MDTGNQDKSKKDSGLGSAISSTGMKLLKWGGWGFVILQLVNLAIFCMTSAIYGYPQNPLQDRQPGAMQGIPPDSNILATIPAATLTSIKNLTQSKNVPWEIPTSILRIESDFGTNGSNYAGLTDTEWKDYCDAALGTGFGSEGGTGGGGGESNSYELWLSNITDSNGTTWSTPIPTLAGVWPDVAVRPTDGDVFVVGTDYQDNVYYGDSHGSFAQTILATQTGAAPARPRGTFDAAGNFYPVWQARASSGDYHTFLAKIDTSGNVVGQPIDVTAGLNLQTGKEPDIAISSNGNFYLAQEADGGEVGVAISSDGGQHWTWKRIGSGVAGNTGPRIAIDSNGQIHVVYVNSSDVIANDSNDNGNDWTSGTHLDTKGTPGHRAFWPSIASDQSGNTFVAWQEDAVSASGSSEISFARFSAGSWQPEVQNISHTTTNLAARVPGVALAGSRLWVTWSVDTDGGSPAGGDAIYSDDAGSTFSIKPTVVAPHTFDRPGPWTAAAGANGSAYFLAQLAGSSTSNTDSTNNNSSVFAITTTNPSNVGGSTNNAGISINNNSGNQTTPLTSKSATSAQVSANDYSYLQKGDRGDNQFGLPQNWGQNSKQVPSDTTPSATNTPPPSPTNTTDASTTPTPTPEVINDPCPCPDAGTFSKPAPDGNPAVWNCAGVDLANVDKSTKILIELLAENGVHIGNGPGIQSGILAFKSDQNYFYRVLQVSGSYGFILPGSFADKLINLTREQLGKIYVWGATGPDHFDCSGLTWYVHNQLDVSIPRNSQAQYFAAAPVAANEVLPGDMFFLEDTYADPLIRITHVGIYIGGGLVIHAPEEGEPITITKVDSTFFQQHWYGFARAKRPGMIPPTAGITDGTDPNSPIWDTGSGGGVGGSPNGGDWHDFDVRNGEPTAKSIDDWLNHHFSIPSPQVSEAPAGHTIGEVYIEMGRKYHINPAFVLAIFSQESTAATVQQGNMAAHDYGNIKWTADCNCPEYTSYMQDPNTGEWVPVQWRSYATWTDGMEDVFRLLKDYYFDELHRYTVSDIISKWCPSADPLNPSGITQIYISHVEDWMTEMMNGY